MEFAWPELIGVLCGFLAFIYMYLTWTFGTFKKMGLPSPKPIPLLGTLLPVLMKKPFHEVDLSRMKKYGRIFGTFEGRKPSLNVSDPDMLKAIMQKDFQYFVNRRDLNFKKLRIPEFERLLTALKDEEWKAARNVLTPSFTTGRMKHMLTLMSECSKQCLINCDEYANSRKSFDILKLFKATTMDTIAKCGFGIQLDALQNSNHPFVANAAELTSPKIRFGMIIFIFFPKILDIVNFEVIPRSAVQFFARTLNNLLKIREQETSSVKRKDFLQLMIDARKDDGKTKMNEDDDEAKDDDVEVKAAKYSAKNVLDDTTIVGQSIQLLLAGYETTGLTLSFAAHSLATNPTFQDRLIEEIDEVIDQDSEILYENLSEYKMPYLDKVICETLRMYPPGFRVDRECTKDYIYDERIPIPKGMIVSIPIYALHHNPEFYPDPETFDPERFSPENRASRHQFSYLPFGNGPRNCIGMRFALMEVKLVLVEILRKYRFITCEETEIPVELTTISLLNPKNPIMLKLEPRFSSSE